MASNGFQYGSSEAKRRDSQIWRPNMAAMKCALIWKPYWGATFRSHIAEPRLGAMLDQAIGSHSKWILVICLVIHCRKRWDPTGYPVLSEWYLGKSNTLSWYGIGTLYPIPSHIFPIATPLSYVAEPVANFYLIRTTEPNRSPFRTRNNGSCQRNRDL